MSCDAKIRPMPDDTELSCRLDHFVTTDGTEHEGELRDYAYLGSLTVVHWLEGDRRTFRGEWSKCVGAGCVLPGGHRGACAL